MKVHYPKLYNMAHCFTASKGSNNYFYKFAITAAGIVQCGGPKKVSPHIIHSADYIFLLILWDQ